MPRATRSLGLNIKPRRSLIPLYAASLLLIFHSFVIAYINSSYLEQFLSTTGIGAIYTIGSAVSILTFLFISRVLHRVGNFKLTLALLILDFFSVIGMAFADSLREAIPLFLIHIVTVPLIVFNLDVFIEARIGNNESSTGTRRGLLLGLSSLVGAVTPLISSLLVNETTESFTLVYFVSASTLIPIIAILISFFSDFTDPEYTEIKVFKAIRSFWVRNNIRSVFIASFILQMFFMAMVVYAPLYLTDEIGLTWAEFGIVMFFAQLAYVIFEYPVGIIGDKYIGEKEMMGFGFLILAISTSWMAFITVSSVLVWSIVLFFTRVGASLVEATTEAYFFKKANGSDAQIISFFRMTRPFAYVIGALLASLVLLYMPLNLFFVAVALLMIPALFITLSIEDTK